MAQRPTLTRARLSGVSLAALMVAVPMLVATPLKARAQAVEVNGVAQPGSPTRTTTLDLFNGDTLTVEAGGSISVTAGNAVDAGGTTTITNAGVITSTVADGINSSIMTLTNSGTITGNNHGIDADGITGLTNSGTITGSIDGIFTTNIGNLTNSGTITGGTHAMLENGSGDTQLTLLSGSVLDGAIDLGGGVNTLSVGRGLSLATTIEELDAIGTASGSPFITEVTGVNTLVAVVDPTSLGLADEGLADLAGGIFGVLSSRQSGFGSGSSISPLGYAPLADEPTSFDAVMANERVRHVWGEVFGSYRTQDGTGNVTDTTSGVGGLIIGVDGTYSDTLTLGGFLGVSWGQSETDSGTQETDTTNVFAGVYGAFVQPGMTYDFALVGGHSRYDQERQVANNLVAGGLETASADYNGWFLSPELTVRATHFQSFEPFVTLRYAGLFLDGFTETGTAAPLTLESQTLHLATGRLGITLPYEWTHGDRSQTRLRLTGGVEARSQFGGTTQRGVLLGQSIAFEAGDTDAVFGGFIGLDAEHRISSSTTLYAGAEGLIGTGHVTQISANAGIRVAF